MFFSLYVMSNQVSVVLEHVPSMWCDMIRGRELWHESAIRIHQGTQSKWTKKKNPVVFQKHFTVTEWFVSIKYNTLAQTPSSSLEISGGPVLTRKMAIQTWIYTRTRKLEKNAFVLNQFSRWTLDVGPRLKFWVELCSALRCRWRSVIRASNNFFHVGNFSFIKGIIRIKSNSWAKGRKNGNEWECGYPNMDLHTNTHEKTRKKRVRPETFHSLDDG